MRRGAATRGARGGASSAFLFVVRAALPLAFLLFIPGLFEQFEAPKAALLRVLGLAALASGLAAARAFGFSRFNAVDAALLAWLGVEVLATVFSDSPRISLFGEPEQREGLLTSLAFSGLYLAARLGSRSASDVQRTLDVALVSAALASLYALAQALGVDPLRWTRTAAFSGLAMRPFGTFGHPNLLGLVSGASASAALALALSHPRRRPRYVLVAILGTLATTLTLSRGAWLGTAAGFLTAALLAWRTGAARAIPARVRWIAAGVLALLAAAPLAASAQWREFLRQRLVESLAAGGKSGSARLEIWRTALAAWRTQPGLGHGPDTFSLVFPRHQTAEYWRIEWSGLPQHAHSLYLHTLATRGALGVAALGGCIAALAWAARAAWCSGEESRRLVAASGAGLAALGVAGLFGSIGMGGTLLFFVFAAGLATLATPASPPPAGRAVRAALLAGLAAGLLALGWVSADLAAAHGDRRGLSLMDYSTRISGPSARLARRAAAKAYESAAAFMPFEDAIFRRRADSLRFLAALEPDPRLYLAEAEFQARRAVALAPLRSLNHRYLGLILLAQAQLGDASRIQEGEACYARCIELAPHDALAMLELARAEIELGRPRQALPPAARAAALYPGMAEPFLVLARAHLAVGEAGPAIAALERSLAADWLGREAERREAERALESLRAAPRRGTPG